MSKANIPPLQPEINPSSEPRTVGQTGPTRQQELCAAALAYRRMGWAPTPVQYGGKRALLGDWNETILTEAEIEEQWSRLRNVGLVLGKPSGGLIDVDLDDDLAVEAAPKWLPKTGMISGRTSRPRSHYFYRITDQLPDSRRFQHLDGASILEIRSTGEQTVVPPSVYKRDDGGEERYSWDEFREPGETTAEIIIRRATLLTLVVMVARAWPKEGSRQYTSMAMARVLLEGGLDEAEATLFLESVAQLAKDEELRQRLTSVGTTAHRLAAEKPATGAPTLAKQLKGDGAAVVKRLVETLRELSGATSEQRTGKTTTGGRKNEATRLVQLALAQAEFWQDSKGKPWTTIPLEDHRENWPLASEEFCSWLAGCYCEASGRAPSESSIRAAVLTLKAYARKGPRHPVYVRVAEHEGAVYVDLCDAQWRAVRITTEGWRVTPESPVKFCRYPDEAPLPEPQHGGDLSQLFEFVHVTTPEGQALVLGWVLGSLAPRGPYPILVLIGEKGSGKTTAARFLRQLVDPTADGEGVSFEPRSTRNLVVAAYNSWVHVVDNLSWDETDRRVNLDWLANALCCVSTGAAYRDRELYTNYRLSVFSVQRPLILTMIHPPLTRRTDLQDRLLIVTVPHFEPGGRRTERKLWRRFSELHPLILGALFDRVAQALRLEGTIEIDDRMADFVSWAAAGLRPDYSEQFLAARRANRAAAAMDTLEDSPVAQAVIEFFEEQEQLGKCTVELTATELLEKLNEIATGELNKRATEETKRKPGWPQTPSELGAELQRLAPALRAQGIEAIQTRKGHKRWRLWVLKRVDPATVPSIEPSAELDSAEAAEFDEDLELPERQRQDEDPENLEQLRREEMEILASLDEPPEQHRQQDDEILTELEDTADLEQLRQLERAILASLDEDAEQAAEGRDTPSQPPPSQDWLRRAYRETVETMPDGSGVWGRR